MCTVTFIAQQRGYCLGMNRDEKLTRPIARPPGKREINGRIALGPSEPGGGTWITVNDRGATLALVNWYAVQARVEGGSVSRGDVVRAASLAGSHAEVELAISRLRLERINPFRLIGIFPASRKIVEWRWNLKQLARKELPWETRQWVSSGFDEPKAQRVRGYTFRLAKLQRSLAGLDWLRRLHRSHAPRTGPFSTCMHRADAATVAYTEIAVSSRQAILRYCAGAPCQNPTRSVHRLRLRAG